MLPLWSMVYNARNSSLHHPRGVVRGENCNTLFGIFRDDAIAQLRHSLPSLRNITTSHGYY